MNKKQSKARGAGHSSAKPSENQLDFPPPDILAERAMKEPNRKLLQDYRDTINILHQEKGFSFREIATWLTENGIEADYNAVYRVYSKGLSAEEERDLAQSEAERGEG